MYLWNCISIILDLFLSYFFYLSWLFILPHLSSLQPELVLLVEQNWTTFPLPTVEANEFLRWQNHRMVEDRIYLYRMLVEDVQSNSPAQNKISLQQVHRGPSGSQSTWYLLGPSVCWKNHFPASSLFWVILQVQDLTFLFIEHQDVRVGLFLHFSSSLWRTAQPAGQSTNTPGFVWVQTCQVINEGIK